MRKVGVVTASILALLVAAAAGRAVAQEQADEVVAEDAAAADEDLLGEDELDDLVAPVALYPDALLAQVFVAATYPLEIVKADQFVAAHADAADDERARLAEQEDWDPSVQVLAVGFPDVIDRMAGDIDWTEQLGDALLTQTDDVLDAIQRMRDRAVATGYLADNEAQVVEEQGDNISIAPADPDVVYVPSYDPVAAYTTPVSAAPVVVDSGISTGEILTTGAIAFGGAMLLDEIFDDDDDWDDYWRGPPPFDWDDDAFYPRRDVDIDGDVNFNRDREINIDRDRVNIDRDRVDVDRDAVRGKIGNIDRDNIDVRKDGSWQASDERKRAARDKIEARREPGQRDGAKAQAARDKMAARGEADSGARERLSAAAAKRKPDADRAAKASALKKHAADKPRAKQAVARADGSRAKAAGQSRPKAAAQAKPKQVAKAHKAKPKAKKSPKHASALKKQQKGHKAKAAKGRGAKSHAKKRR